MAGISAGKAVKPNEAAAEKTIKALKKLLMEIIDVDVALQRAIYTVEKIYDDQRLLVFDKRLKVLEEYRKSSAGNGEHLVKNFWLQVIKSTYTKNISEQDEDILTHLIDLRSIFYNEPDVKFVLQFTFEPNCYFENRTLTKSYFIKYQPEADNPFSFDGAEIVRCEGCQIEWKSYELGNAQKGKSFFEFFTPPELPEDPNDPNYTTIKSFLKKDYNFGFYLRDEVIPKAILPVIRAIEDERLKSNDVPGNSDDNEAGISGSVTNN